MHGWTKQYFANFVIIINKADSNLVPRLFSLTFWCHSQKDPGYEDEEIRICTPELSKLFQAMRLHKRDKYHAFLGFLCWDK
jgi:hypothetical protein